MGKVTEKTVRILHVLGRLDRGGAETMVMNLYRHMDRERIQFDFVIHTEDVCDYTEEIQRMGGRIYSMRPFRWNTAAGYRRQWRKFLRVHPEYSIIHGHMRSTASLYLAEARRAGRVAIAHSHNTSSGSGLSAVVKNILQFPLRFQADYLFACSVQAGIWLYGRRACQSHRFHVLPNGIETAAFQFDAGRRQKIRQELLGSGASDMPVFVHAGRMEPQKNHDFLIQVMEEVGKLCPDACLWLCGSGPLQGRLEDVVRASGLPVRFLGVRTDMAALLQAADGMIFPSLFEGLPVTLVEAQAAGLPVLMSDTITREVVLTGLVETLPLAAPPAQWARRGLEMARQVRNRSEFAGMIRQRGYDAAENARKLARFYRGVLERHGSR